MNWLIPLLVFLSLLAGAWAVYGTTFAQKRASQADVKRRLESLGTSPQAVEIAARSYFKDRSYSTIPYLNRLLERLPNISDLQLLIHQAGSPCNLGTLVLACGVFATLGFLAGLLEQNLVLSVILAVTGMMLPIFWLRFLRKRRLGAFEEQFSEAVELIARALRAGHSFSAGLRMAADEMEEPVSGELQRTFDDYAYGKGLEEALTDLSRRMGLQDVKFFATAVSLQREIGGNLTEILENIGYIIRQRFSLMRQVKALSAEGRISAIILVLMAPGLLGALYILSPGYMSLLFEHPTGRMLLIAGGCFQGLGILIIRKIIKLKV